MRQMAEAFTLSSQLSACCDRVDSWSAADESTLRVNEVNDDEADEVEPVCLTPPGLQSFMDAFTNTEGVNLAHTRLDRVKPNSNFTAKDVVSKRKFIESTVFSF
jgi:hypothetical protein